MEKQETIFGPFQGTTFTVVTLNRESNCTCRETHRSQSRYIDVTRPTSTTMVVMFERHTDDHWNIEGDRDLSDLWTGFTIYQIGRKTTRWVDMVWGRSKRHPDLINWGQEYREELQKQRNQTKDKNGRSKNQSLTIVESCEGFTSLIQQVWNSRKLFKMRGGWEFRCQQHCFARPEDESARKLFALLRLARQNTHASLKPTNIRGRVWKGFYIKIHEDHTVGKGINSLNHYNFVHKFFLCFKKCQYQKLNSSG